MLYGAATHDSGKVVHPDELTGPGHRHEAAGYHLLTARGVPARLTRFARTHATWADPDTTVDDHVVSLADKIWKAQRVPDLEDVITAHLAVTCGTEQWQAFAQLDKSAGPRDGTVVRISGTDWVAVTGSGRQYGQRKWRCGTDVCSAVPVPHDTGRHCPIVGTGRLA